MEKLIEALKEQGFSVVERNRHNDYVISYPPFTEPDRERSVSLLVDYVAEQCRLRADIHDHDEFNWSEEYEFQKGDFAGALLMAITKQREWREANEV